MSELEPLDDDILSIVAAAKNVPELEAQRKASIFEATTTKIGAAGPDGDGGGGGGGGSGGGGGTTGTATGLGKLALAATFVAGIAVGIVGDRLITKSELPAIPSAVTEHREVAPAVSIAQPLPIEAVSAASLPDAPRAPATPSMRATASGEAPSSRGLAAERGLLDVARSALARGEASEALVATSRHAREYPDGMLVEEREAIAIKALVALGRRDEARARLKQLEQRFPNGLTLRAVKAVVEGAP